MEWIQTICSLSSAPFSPCWPRKCGSPEVFAGVNALLVNSLRKLLHYQLYISSEFEAVATNFLGLSMSLYTFLVILALVSQEIGYLCFGNQSIFIVRLASLTGVLSLQRLPCFLYTGRCYVSCRVSYRGVGEHITISYYIIHLQATLLISCGLYT